MNKWQMLVMWVGIGIIALMGIFPPHMLCLEGSKAFIGYSFIASSANMFDTQSDITRVPILDFTRLLTQWSIVSVIMVGLIITFQNRKD